MEQKYLKIVRDFEELDKSLSQSVSFDPELHGRYKKLKPFYPDASRLLKIENELAELEAMKNDDEIAPIYEEEKAVLNAEYEKVRKNLVALLSKSPFEGKPVIVEIRAGTGGLEAGLFAGDLFKMYQKAAEIYGLKLKIFSLHALPMGGVKEVIFEVAGEKAYYYFRFECGVHRVQRIPSTESGGRIHTSAASVAVYPEPEEVDIKIEPADLRIDTYRSSGKGGQHVNKTDSAVRITHIPTGAVASCQNERSQFQNKTKAMTMLKAKIYEKQAATSAESTNDIVRSQVGSADRSEKIRTYNFPQNRVTDHRIKFTIYNLAEFMEGRIAAMTEKMVAELGG
ncbi:peptide chain release factor 1 [bacterium]|nr:peptide chain release factor 1 [bacterium]MBU3955962.1 peptide chain release factor 1 [bacterium]